MSDSNQQQKPLNTYVVQIKQAQLYEIEIQARTANEAVEKARSGDGECYSAHNAGPMTVKSVRREW